MIGVSHLVALNLSSVVWDDGNQNLVTCVDGYSGMPRLGQELV